jgi:Protein SET DOMAIN GROUP 2 C-terminal
VPPLPLELSAIHGYAVTSLVFPVFLSVLSNFFRWAGRVRKEKTWFSAETLGLFIYFFFGTLRILGAGAGGKKGKRKKMYNGCLMVMGFKPWWHVSGTGIADNRVQNVAITLDKVKLCLKKPGQLHTPPLRLVPPEQAMEHIWSGKHASF